MKNIISPIDGIIKEDSVKESFLKYFNEYNNNKTESVNNKSEHSPKQKQVLFAFNELVECYSEIFTKEVNLITKEIKIQEVKDNDNFTDFLLINYKELLSLFNEKELKKPAQFKFDKSVRDSKYIKYAMRLVNYHLQNKFVLPIINFIDVNYISFLFELTILPLPMQKLMDEIRNSNLVLEALKTDKPLTSKFHPVRSELDRSLYYLSYNSFVDLYSYHSYLNEIVNEFEEYSNQTFQLIEDPSEKINLYNKIRLTLKFALLSFSKVDSSNTTEVDFLPKYARNDTSAIVHQFINESFKDTQKVKFNPGLIDFQDLQYSITNRALLFITKKITILNDSQKLIDKQSKSVNGVPQSNSFHDKIRTNLTVPQLSYLFNCLFAENDILDEKNKTALRRSISSCFTSKRSEDISAESIRTSLKKLNEKVIDFWIEKWIHMIQLAKKDRKNIRS